jgi:hypothetical protein
MLQDNPIEKDVPLDVKGNPRSYLSTKTFLTEDVIEFISVFEMTSFEQDDLIEALPKPTENNMEFYCNQISIIRRQMRRLREDKMKLVKMRQEDFLPEHQ